MKTSTLKIIIVTSMALGTVGFAAAQKREPTRGIIPNDATTGGGVDLDKVPDYIVAYGRDGQVAGYVAKADVFGVDHQPRLVVVDDTLKRVVGHMVVNRGFVPIGTDDDAIPTFEESTELPPEN
jgi:hypothetical protein